MAPSRSLLFGRIFKLLRTNPTQKKKKNLTHVSGTNYLQLQLGALKSSKVIIRDRDENLLKVQSETFIFKVVKLGYCLDDNPRAAAETQGHSHGLRKIKLK